MTLCARLSSSERILPYSDMDGVITMRRYECSSCGYVYDPALGDPEAGIPPGTPFEDLPDDWECPVCYVGKDEFEPIDE